jgi:hypothetical protein
MELLSQTQEIIHRELHLLKPTAKLTKEIERQTGIDSGDLEKAKGFAEVMKSVEQTLERIFMFEQKK